MFLKLAEMGVFLVQSGRFVVVQNLFIEFWVKYMSFGATYLKGTILTSRLRGRVLLCVFVMYFDKTIIEVSNVVLNQQ